MNANNTLPSPWLTDGCKYDQDTCLRFEKFVSRYDLRTSATRYADICVPFDSEQFDETASCEKVLKAPTWLFSHGDPLVNGFVDSIAVYHLLGVNLWWAEKGAGSHVSRYAQWLARPGMQTYREQHVGMYVEAAEHLVKSACSHNDISHMRLLVKHLMLHAMADNALPILPGFSCNCAWIHRGNESILGHEDHRLVDDGTNCYPSPAGQDSCFPGKQFTYPFLVPVDAKVVSMEIIHTKENVSHVEQTNLKHECASFFESTR